MPILVDPRTGEQYDYDGLSEQEQASDQKRFGLQTLEDYQRVKAAEAEGQLKSGARVAAQTLLAIPEALTKIDPFQPKPEELSPDAQAYYEKQGAALQEFAGKAKGAAEAYPVTGTVAAALPAVGAGIAAAPLATGALGTLATEAAVGATLGEAGAAATEGREVSAKGALYNGVLGAGFAGLGLGLGAAYRAVTGRVADALTQTAERTVQRRVPGAIMGEGVQDAESLARAAEVAQQRTESTLGRIDEALSAARPPVVNNPSAQRAAMQGLADQMRDAQPELAARIEELMGKPRLERYRGLLDLESTNPNVANALDGLRSDPALWGDKAVSQGQAILAARAARPSGPGAVLDALQGFDDPAIGKLAGDLSQHLDNAGGIEAARAFQETRSVGAAGAGPELMPTSEVNHFVRNDREIVDQMRTMAGGGEGEKGAFQEFQESFRKVTANRIKREDFRRFAPELDEATTAALHAERDAIVDSIPDVVQELKARGGTKAANRVTELATGLSRAETGEIAPIMDQLKQRLDDINVMAVRDPGDPFATVKGTVDPVVERIRGTLENPRYVGDKIAELQQVRNAAWSDRETGFIQNMKVANELGPKLFKRIDVDYHTGDLVMQFDPGAFKQLLGMDWHESKPVLEAWAKALDSAERMAANTVEVGAESAARTPISQLQNSIGRLRQIFETQAKRIAVRDIAEPGLAALNLAEQLPGVGRILKAARGLAPGRLEGAAAGVGSRYVPVPTRSVEGASAALRRTAGEAPPVAPRAPVPPPEPPTTPPAAAASPMRKTAPPDVGGEVAANDVAQQAAAQARDVRVSINGELDVAPPDVVARLAPEMQNAADNAIAGKSLKDLRALPLDESDRATVEALKRDEYFRQTGNVRDNFGSSRAGLPQVAIEADGSAYLRNGRHRLAAAQELGLDRIQARVLRYDAAGNTLWEAELPVKVSAAAPARKAQAGFAEAGALGAAAGAGAAGLGGYKAYQLAQTPEEAQAQAQRDQHLELLQQHAQADLDETARALTDPDYAARWARQSVELPTTLESFQGLHRTLQQAYTERREAIERAVQDPDSLVEHLAGAIGDLPAEVGLKAFQLAQYLAKELPPKRGVTVTRPNGLPPDPLEMRSWALKYQTALDPSTAFDDAKRGTLRHEQVQTLKAVWPERYDALCSATLLAMGNGKSSVNQRMRADLLFGFGSTLDPAFSRRLAAAARPAYEQRSKAGGSPGGAFQTRMPSAMTPGGIGALQLGASAPLQ